MSLGNTLASTRFQDLLVQLTDAHSRDIDQVQRECDLKISNYSEEIQALREQLRRAGVPPSYQGPLGEGPTAAQEPGAEGRAPGVAKLASGAEGDNPFELKTAWVDAMEGAAWGSSLDSFLVRCGANGERASEEENGIETDPRGRGRCLVLPNSVFRVNWDFVGLFLICYDLITIPFNSAFQPEPDWCSIAMDWITLLFWTGDMVQGFFLAYFEKGQLITNHTQILKRYLSTWFLADLVVVGPEWIMTLIFPSGDSGAAGAGKILKSVRAVRVLRLLRLAKVQRMLNMIYDLIESEYTFIVINLAKLLVSVLVLNHVVACLWYITGKFAMDNEMISWIQTSGVMGEAVGYIYSTSLHWSLTQFTPASMDVNARNIIERIFSIVILFFAMVVFSSIVGSISGSMTTLRSMKSDQMKQFWLLRRYLRQRKVSKDLSSRIYKYLEHQSRVQNNHVQPCQIKVLEGLSESLQNELTHQMHSPHLLEHPFFRYLNEEMEVVMHRLCRLALRQQSYAEREFVFGAGDEAKKVYFVKGGTLDYVTMDRTSLKPPPQAKEWISEALLWTPWRHQGDLLATIESELISVDPTEFVNVMSVHPRPWLYAKQYALRFIRFLNRLDRHAVSDIIRHPGFYRGAIDSIESNGQSCLLDEDTAGGPRRAAQSAEAAAEADAPSAEVMFDAHPLSKEPPSAGAQPGPLPPAVRRRVLGFCPCPAPFSSVVPGPNVAVTWR